MHMVDIPGFPYPESVYFFSSYYFKWSPYCDQMLSVCLPEAPIHVTEGPLTSGRAHYKVCPLNHSWILSAFCWTYHGFVWRAIHCTILFLPPTKILIFLAGKASCFWALTTTHFVSLFPDQLIQWHHCHCTLFKYRQCENRNNCVSDQTCFQPGLRRQLTREWQRQTRQMRLLVLTMEMIKGIKNYLFWGSFEW